MRFSLGTAFASTTLLTGCLALVHPYLAALTIPDWFYLTAFSTQILNNTINAMVLDKDKYHVHINKFNLLGFLREGRGEQVLIRDI